jgi:phospholipid transport system substrate-binding protein
MNIVRFELIMWILAFLLLSPSILNAGDASKQLGATIDGFVPIISKTPRAELQAKGLPESARKLIVARFDFSDMTQRSLGRHWKSLNARDQKQFVEAFTQWQLISFGQIVRSYRGDKVEFIREVQNGKDVSVETKLAARYSGGDLPIHYWLHNVNGQWKVFNMVIDDVDIVKNVNAQFERVVAKSSLQELLQRVKDQNPRSSVG